MKFGREREQGRGPMKGAKKGADFEDEFGFGDRHGNGGHGGRRAASRGPGGRGGGSNEKGMRQGRGRGGRGGRRIFDSSELRLVMLKLIQQAPRHGYDVIRAIEDLSGGVYAPSPGVVYPALSMMEDIGQIDIADTEGSKKSFSITEQGAAELSAAGEHIESLMSRLEMLAHDERRLNAAPIKRAMMGLRTAVRDRMVQESTTDDDVHAVAAILDSAAQQIERLKPNRD